jgi:putative oxidoreductase
MVFQGLDKHRDLGLLILRVGIGISFMFHGLPKLLAGPELWAQLGGALGLMGVHFAPTFMGLVASLSEFIGGFLLVIGLFVRPASFFMLNTLIVATIMHLKLGDSFDKYSHALELAIVFLSLIIIGAGKYSLDNLIFNQRTKAKPSPEKLKSLVSA